MNEHEASGYELIRSSAGIVGILCRYDDSSMLRGDFGSNKTSPRSRLKKIIRLHKIQ